MNWKEIVGTVAPLLGGTLGGPFGAMAGKFIADSLGVEESNLEETVLNASPDTMLQIKKLDADFKVKMKELGISEERLHAGDRDSARDMAKHTSIAPQVLQSVMYDVAFVMVCYLLFTTEMAFSDSQQTLITFVMGMLSTGLIQVNNFWFGSSSGSKDKTKKLSSK